MSIERRLVMCNIVHVTENSRPSLCGGDRRFVDLEAVHLPNIRGNGSRRRSRTRTDLYHCVISNIHVASKPWHDAVGEMIISAIDVVSDITLKSLGCLVGGIAPGKVGPSQRYC